MKMVSEEYFDRQTKDTQKLADIKLGITSQEIRHTEGRKNMAEH